MDYIDVTPTIHIISQPMDRKRVDVEIILTSGGSWFEGSQDRGKKHLLEHCILSRTKNMNFNQLKDYTFRENIYINAYTSKQTMGFEAGGHYSDFTKMIDLLVEVVLSPTFDQEDLDREKEIVLREIDQRRGDPNYQYSVDVAKIMYTPESVDNHEILGDPELVSQTKIEDFYRLHSQNLATSHIYICVYGGGIDTGYIQSVVKKYTTDQEALFSDTTIKNPVDLQLPSTFNDFTFLPIVHPFAHSHAEVTLYIDMPINWQNDPALTMFNFLYLKNDGILYDRLRNELGLVYGIGAGFAYKQQLLCISFSAEIKNIEIIIQEIKKTFADFDKNFKPNRFEEFKKIIYKKQEMAEDSSGSMINFTLNFLKMYGKIQSYQDYTDRLVAVSTEDIRETYNIVKTGLDTMKIVVNSKDESIKNIDQNKLSQ